MHMVTPNFRFGFKQPWLRSAFPTPQKDLWISEPKKNPSFLHWTILAWDVVKKKTLSLKLKFAEEFIMRLKHVTMES